MNLKKARNFIRTMIVFFCIGVGMATLTLEGWLGSQLNANSLANFLGAIAGIVSLGLVGLATILLLLEEWWP